MEAVRKLAQGAVEVLPGREEQDGLPAGFEERELALFVGVGRKRERDEGERRRESSLFFFRRFSDRSPSLFSLSLSASPNSSSSLTSSTNSAFTLLQSSVRLILIPSKIERSTSTGLEEGERLSGEETEVIGKEQAAALPFSIALAESSAARDRAACSLLFDPIFGRRERNQRGEASGAEERPRLGVEAAAPRHSLKRRHLGKGSKDGAREKRTDERNPSL